MPQPRHLNFDILYTKENENTQIQIRIAYYSLLQLYSIVTTSGFNQNLKNGCFFLFKPAIDQGLFVCTVRFS